MKKRLGDIARIRTGRTPADPWKRQLYDKNCGMPFVRVKDITESNGRLNNTEMKVPNHITHESVDALPDTVLLSISGTIGAATVLNIHALFNQAIVAIDQTHNIIPEFLMFNLISKKLELLSFAYGTCQLNINQDIVKMVEVPILSLDEQTETIKKILECDNAIRQKKQEIERAEKLKTMLIQRLFK